jgi:hypothetical protein
MVPAAHLQQRATVEQVVQRLRRPALGEPRPAEPGQKL